MASVASGQVQGAVATPTSGFHEFINARGWNTMHSTQRVRSSASGFGPEKPPMSWPTRPIADSESDSALRMFHFSVCQEVSLSPVQVSA